MNINPSIPLYQNIKEYVENLIKSGQLLPGQELITEDELMQKFNVSKITTRKAMSLLLDEGLIYRIRGKGTFVSDNIKSPVNSTKKRSSGLIGFICPNVHSEHVSLILCSIEKYVTDLGYNLVVYNSYINQERESLAIQRLKEINVDGIIIYPVDHMYLNNEILKLKVENFPFVVVDKYFPQIETNCVCSDNLAGSYKATKMLIDQGYRDIGFIPTQTFGCVTSSDRLKGYELALADSGIAINRDHIMNMNFDDLVDPKGITSYQQVHKLYIQIKEEIRSYIKKFSDLKCFVSCHHQVVWVALEEGIVDTMKFALFDDSELIHYLKQDTIFITQQSEEIGVKSAQLLIDCIKGRVSNKKFVLPMILI